MKIKDIMTATPCFVLSNATLQEAAQKMQQLDCGFIPVGDNDKIIGILTDRDIAVRAVAQGLPPSTKVSEIATKNVLYCFQDETVDHIAENMAENQVRRLIVLSDKKSKRLVGVVSVADISTSKNANALTSASLIKGVSLSDKKKSSSRAA
jgi:CBS domain-containing protein